MPSLEGTVALVTGGIGTVALAQELGYPDIDGKELPAMLQG